MGKLFQTVQDGYDYLKTLRVKDGIDIFYSGPDAVSMQFIYEEQGDRHYRHYRHYSGVSVRVCDFPKRETYDENTIVVYTKTSSIPTPYPTKHIFFWENDDSVRNVRSRIMNVYKNCIDKRWKCIFKHKEKYRRIFEAGRALDSYYKTEFAQVFVNIMTRVIESLENRILYNIITEAIETDTPRSEDERLKTILVLTNPVDLFEKPLNTNNSHPTHCSKNTYHLLCDEFVPFKNIREKIYKDLGEVIVTSYSRYTDQLEADRKTASKLFCDKKDACIIIEKLVNLENYKDIVKAVKEYIKTIVDEKLYDFTSSDEVRSIVLKSKKSKYFCETTRTFDVFLLQPVLLKYLAISVSDIREKFEK